VRRELDLLAKSNDLTLTAAADFIYLVNTAFNGAWSVNVDGCFSGAITGKPRPWRVRPTSLFRASSELSDVELRAQDFRVALDAVQPEDLVFVDPPT
jgi:site-specific DNA-adenine methylase